jgi:flagellar motor switch protein FliN
MMPSDIDQSEAGAEMAASGFDQAAAGLVDFGDGQGAGISEVSHVGTSESGTGEDGADFGAHSAMIMGLPVMMKVVLGTARMPVATLAKLAKGSVVKLDKLVGDPVDILVNGRLIARGEVVVLNEGTSRFGVVLTQVGSLAGVTK